MLVVSWFDRSMIAHVIFSAKRLVLTEAVCHNDVFVVLDTIHTTKVKLSVSTGGCGQFSLQRCVTGRLSTTKSGCDPD